MAVTHELRVMTVKAIVDETFRAALKRLLILQIDRRSIAEERHLALCDGEDQIGDGTAGAGGVGASGVIARSSLPETSVIGPRSRGVLDRPHARGMTAENVRRVSALYIF